MAELTVLDEKLAEVIGLAMAAQGATDKIVALTDDDELSEKLQQMHEEARETRSGAHKLRINSTVRRRPCSTRRARRRPRPPR